MMFSDGAVEFRDRTTMELLSPDVNDDQISSLHQIGFNFLGVRPCKSWHDAPDLEIISRSLTIISLKGLHATLSPNAAATFALSEHHAATLNVLQYSNLTSPSGMSEMNDSVYLPQPFSDGD